MHNTAIKKIGKFERFFKPDAEAVITFKVEKDRYIFETAIYSNSTIIRAEESSNDMYASMDMVVEKLERQIRKYKTKLGKQLRQEAMVPENFVIHENIDEESDYDIVRTKRFPLKPMNTEEAILQMNLLSHNLFVFYEFRDRNGQQWYTVVKTDVTGLLNLNSEIRLTCAKGFPGTR